VIETLAAACPGVTSVTFGALDARYTGNTISGATEATWRWGPGSRRGLRDANACGRIGHGGQCQQSPTPADWLFVNTDTGRIETATTRSSYYA
jgi:hypothetical protein